MNDEVSVSVRRGIFGTGKTYGRSGTGRKWKEWEYALFSLHETMISRTPNECSPFVVSSFKTGRSTSLRSAP